MNEGMPQHEVTALDVIRAFYISNELLGEIFDEKVHHGEKGIHTALEKITHTARKLHKNKLLTYKLGDFHPRYDNYLNSRWELKEVSLDDCGVWPKMGGLPAESTYGSVVDTAVHLLPYLEDKTKLSLKTARVLYLEEMMKYAEDINKHVPIIVMEGGVIRHNKLTKPSDRKHFKKCLYDIDDGNHRALALAMLGKKTIHAYVGKRISKSSLLYF